MAKITKDRLFSPLGILFLYIAASFVAVTGFVMALPPKPAPLAYFAVPWRFTLGLVEYIRLFPALVMAALVIPFGLKLNDGGRVDRALKFIERVQISLFAAMIGVICYGLLFLLALPLARSAEVNMRSKGRLFEESAAKAEYFAGEEVWPEAARFAAICEAIWPDSPRTADIRRRAFAGIDTYRNTHRLAPSAIHAPKEQGTALGLRSPVDVREALQFAETAYQEERYYDSHWLAVLGGRLAREGSAEAAAAARAASNAWNAIASLAPTSQEARNYRIYRQKHAGYEAMIAEDWIRAYYIFKDALVLAPGDADTVKFLAETERNLAAIAFFADEITLAAGEVLTGAVFSMPLDAAGGRLVFRMGGISAFADVSYGTDMELLAFDSGGRLLYRLAAPYIKVLPKTLGERHGTAILVRALDRADQGIRWEPQWAGDYDAGLGNGQITLDISYEDFIFLTGVRDGLDEFSMADLFAAERDLGAYGYIPQVFQVEILSRFAEPALFLPLSILTIILGWRFRSKRPPRYLSIPLLFLLPLVFNGFVQLYRSLLQTLGIWAVLGAGFPAALGFFITGAAVFFLLSLLALAFQRG